MGVGWGVRVVMGTRRPLAGWGGSWQPRLAALSASALTKHPGSGGGLAPRLDFPPYRVPLTVGPRRRECLTQTRGYGWVGSAQPSRFRRGREPRAAVSSLRAACRPPGCPRRGAPSGPRKELEREDRQQSAGERGARPSHTASARPPTPAVRLSAPGSHLQVGEGVRILSRAPGWDAPPSQPRPGGRVHRCL